MNVDWGFTLSVVVTGLVVVFCVLLLLVGVCELMGMFFSRQDKRKNDKTKEADAPKAQPVKAVSAPVSASPVVEAGIGNEVVAAISAAVACVLGSDTPFAVKSIARVKATRGTRPAWNAAGIIESTRPF